MVGSAHPNGLLDCGVEAAAIIARCTGRVGVSAIERTLDLPIRRCDVGVRS
jgi:hypothetical protein